MRILPFFVPVFAIALLASSFCGKKKKKKQEFTVNGTVLLTHSYCGGIVPPAEFLEAMKTPQPAPGFHLFVKKGNTNVSGSAILDTIVTDAQGHFSVSLPAGTYCIVKDWKAPKYSVPQDNQYAEYDTACYRKEYAQCDYLLNLSANVDSLKLVFHEGCSWEQPCMNYHGPLPPAAHPGGHPHNE
ncbi:MAG TPA: hypothetical protein VFU15_10485 [Bacteroidia bacterium]|nr:hypothetical protein [Bacteroidia bacterium]